MKGKEKLAQKRKKNHVVRHRRNTKGGQKDDVSDRGLAFSLGSVVAVGVETKCLISEHGINELYVLQTLDSVYAVFLHLRTYFLGVFVSCVCD